MKILVLNWRDIKNPAAGGAEILTHEMAKRWAKWGNEVVQISSRFPQSKSRETIDSVKIIRMGKWWSVHILAFFYYWENLRSRIDVIIDEVHWFPFFSALYARKKTVLLVCEVADKLFFQVFSYPQALLGRLMEKIYLFIYRGVPTLAISLSSKKDLIKEGFPKEKITVIPMGLATPPGLSRFPKEKTPTLIYLSRVNKQKGIEDAIEVMARVKKELPGACLWVVGSGDEKYLEKIKKKASMAAVKFFGFVSEKKKFELLAKAHLLLVPSFHEGWGLTVPEAGLVGTPAVAYNVGGLRDVIIDGINGVLVRSEIEAMARAIIELLGCQKKWDKLRKGAIKEAKKYHWDKTAQAAFKVLHLI